VLKFLFSWIKDENQSSRNQSKITKSLKNHKLELLRAIKDFPENSHIENYLLFDNIITDEHVNDIINTILSVIKPNKKDDIKKIFLEIDKRKLLSLLVVVSRNSRNGFILSNNMKSLYTTLNTYFFKDFPIEPKDKTIISENIKQIFTNFINQYSSIITYDLINSIISGKELYKIYQIGYIKKNKPQFFSFSSQQKQSTSLDLLSSDLIKKRTYEWLNINNNPILNITPIAYIFDEYSKEEKKILIKTNKFCKEISLLTDNIKDFYSSSLEISKSIFSNNDLDTFKGAIIDVHDKIQKNKEIGSFTRKLRLRSKSRK